MFDKFTKDRPLEQVRQTARRLISALGEANAQSMAAKLVDAGVDTLYLHIAGMTHDFSSTRKALPSAAAAVAKIIAAMKLMLTKV